MAPTRSTVRPVTEIDPPLPLPRWFEASSVPETCTPALPRPSTVMLLARTVPVVFTASEYMSPATMRALPRSAWTAPVFSIAAPAWPVMAPASMRTLMVPPRSLRVTSLPATIATTPAGAEIVPLLSTRSPMSTAVAPASIRPWFSTTPCTSVKRLSPRMKSELEMLPAAA